MNNLKTFRLAEMVFYLFALFLISSTFSIALSQSALGVALLFLLISILVGEKFKCDCNGQLRYFFIAVALYILWMLLSSLLGGSFLFSLNNMREEWLFLIIPITFFLSQNKDRLQKLIAVLAFGVLAISLISLYKLISLLYLSGIDNNAGDSIGRIMGSFSNPLTFGNYFAMASGFLLAYAFLIPTGKSNSIKYYFLTSGILGALATLLSASRGPIISLCAGLILIVIFMSRKRSYLPIIILAGMVLTIIFTPSINRQFTEKIDKHLKSESPNSRLYIWSKSFEIAKDNPIVGVGPGNFSHAYSANLPDDHPEIWKYTHAHNDLLNVSAVAGFPGLILFLMLWLIVLKLTFGSFRRSEFGTANKQLAGAALVGSVVFFVGSMSEASFVDEEVRALLMFIWAVGLSVLYNHGKTGSLGDNINP